MCFFSFDFINYMSMFPICANQTTIICHFTHTLFFIYDFLLHASKLNRVSVIKRPAKRNLVVSITYQEWRVRLCASLPSPVHRLRTTRRRDNCAAAAPPSPPFCSRADPGDWTPEKRGGLVTDHAETSLCIIIYRANKNSNNVKSTWT